MFCKKGFRKNYEKCTGKSLCWSLFCDKIGGWRLWKEDLAQVFFCKFFIIFKDIDISDYLRTVTSKVNNDFKKISLKELVF